MARGIRNKLQLQQEELINVFVCSSFCKPQFIFNYVYSSSEDFSAFLAFFSALAAFAASFSAFFAASASAYLAFSWSYIFTVEIAVRLNSILQLSSTFTMIVFSFTEDTTP